MKNILRLCKLACLAALSLLILSCRGKADYRDILPADAFITVGINPASLLEKSGAARIDECPFYTRLAEQMEQEESMTAEEKEYLLGLLKNPAESGIDLNRDLYYFMSMGGNSLSLSPEMSGGLLLPIGDKAKLDGLIGRLNEKSRTESRTEGGLTFAVIGEYAPMRVICAYNDRAFLLYFTQNAALDLSEQVRTLFAQKREDSLMGKNAAAGQLSDKNDLDILFSYAPLLANNPMLSAMPLTQAMQHATAAASVNFEKGRIVNHTKVFFDDKESEAEMKEVSYVKPQTGALLRYLPASSIGVLSCGLDGKKLYAMLTRIPGYGPMLVNPLIERVMNALNGDFAITFSRMAVLNRNNSPLEASLLAQIQDPAILKSLVAEMNGMPIKQTGENAYSLELGGEPISAGVIDDVLYVTTDPLVKSAIDGTAIESMTAMERIFKKQATTFYVDFEGVDMLVAQYDAFTDTMPQIAIAHALLGLFDTMECYGSMEGATCDIRMKDKEQNALKSICDQVGQLIGQCMAETQM